MSSDNINLSAVSPRPETSTTAPDASQQSRLDAVSEQGYCDSNVAMYIPSVARASPEPTLRSLVYAPTEFSTQPSLTIPPSTNSPEPSIPQLLPTSPTEAHPIAADNISVHATQVRRNWATHLIRNYRSISRTSKLLLLISVSTSLIQILICVIVLSLYWHQTCDSQLRVYIIMYVVRLVISVPITVLYYLKPPRRNRRTSFNLWIDRARSIMDVFAMLLFIVGNYLIYSSTNCREQNLALYILSLALVIIGYFIITIPVFFCGAVIFCLPCVLVVMRVLRVGEATGVGASAELINKLPVLKFDKSLSIKNRPPPSSPGLVPPVNSPHSETHDPSRPASIAPVKKSLFRSLFVSGKKGKAISSSSARRVKPLAILQLEDEADAICAICITEYEDSDEIRKMVCNHHYHVDCVDEWLKQNRTCPLCKRDITGQTDPPISEDEF
ncbi:hypothetical protein DSO57_1009012 [Entomophthora muscae]|uniref:Uncharacterized protein n=1 Tax=Entomophthora muscae TaxID=34485 RepID=A0ACC2UGR6_9FUNG|nr:hypothetical protein DSO57_1009012 [Entomophthora muscae]